MLAGQRILIVEDEPLIGIDLEAAVKDSGGIVVAIASTVVDATQSVETETLHGAIVDLRLRHELATPVLERLVTRNIPFVIHSGQADAAIEAEWPGVPIIDKPALPETVMAALAKAIRDRRSD